MPDAPVKHIKALTLNKQERIVMAEEKTKERLLVVDFFKDVLTGAINSNSKGVLRQLVLLQNFGIGKIFITIERLFFGFHLAPKARNFQS